MNVNNLCTLTGGIATAITVRGEEDKPVVSALIITNDGYYNNAGEWVEQTSAVPVTFFGSAAKRAKQIKKGETWSVSGTIQSGSYEKDGATIRTMELHVSAPGMLQLRAKPKAKADKKSA